MKKLLTFFRKNNDNYQSNQAQKSDRTNILFGFTLFILGMTFFICWSIVINPQASPDVIKYAYTLITAIVSGLLGFATGKAVS